MKTSSFKTSATSGIVFAIIVIFMALIGFTVTGPSMVQKISGNTLSSGTIPSYWSLVVFLGFIGIWNGWRAAKQSEESPLHVTKALINGLLAGSITGLLVMLYAFAVGSISAQGIDLRVYLSLLSPESIVYFVFGKSTFIGGLLQFALFATSGFLGAILAIAADRSNRKISSAKKSISQWSETSWFGSLRKNLYLNYVLMGVVLLLLVLLPRTWGSYWNYIMGTVGIYVLLGLGLNIIVGFSGQLVLGYVAFFAIGAYSFALVTAPEPHNLQWNFWIAILVAVVASAIIGDIDWITNHAPEGRLSGNCDARFWRNHSYFA